MEVKSPMSGNMWKLIAKENDEVESGDTLAILESMKMEIPVDSPKSGKVTKIAVVEGDFVQEGATILTIE